MLIFQIGNFILPIANSSLSGKKLLRKEYGEWTVQVHRYISDHPADAVVRLIDYSPDMSPEDRAAVTAGLAAALQPHRESLCEDCRRRPPLPAKLSHFAFRISHFPCPTAAHRR